MNEQSTHAEGSEVFCSMRWQDENFVRLFKRTTPDWSLVPGPARSLFYSILREVDRAGILPMRKGLHAIAHAIGWPQELFDKYFPDLLDDGCILVEGSNLVVRNFLDAQEVSMSDRQRKEAQRERDQIKALGKETHNSVTSGHAKSQAVTNGHSETRQDKTRQEDPPKSPKGGQAGLDLGSDQTKESEEGSSKRDRTRHTAIPILAYLSEARRRINSACANLEPLDSNLKYIEALLKEGRTPDQLKHVVDVWEAMVRSTQREFRFFNPVTPFRTSNVAQYMAMTIEDARKPPAGMGARSMPQVGQAIPAAPAQSEALQRIRSARQSEQRSEEYGRAEIPE